MRPTRLVIDLNALRHNARLTRQCVGARALCAVVKANAYGHGAVPVARALVAEGVQMLAVALVEEAEALRRAGIACPILVLGGDYRGAYAEVVRLRLVPMLGQLAEVRALADAAAAAGRVQDVHVEIDTGMARLGASPEDAATLARAVADCAHLRLTGVMTHLSHADVPAHPRTAEQLERLAQAYGEVRAICPTVQLQHVISSGALLTAPQAPHEVVRCGLSLYGIQPVAGRQIEGLRPVMQWATKPVAIRRLRPGQSVSYGARWTAARESLVATLPVGYADGYPRLFGNRAQVLVRGQRAPIVGTVCMDLCMVDVTDVPHVSWDDEVVLMGRQGGQTLGAQELSDWAQSIPYEIVARIGPRVRREYVDVTPDAHDKTLAPPESTGPRAANANAAEDAAGQRRGGAAGEAPGG